ncbi:ADP,ATP carrier protein 1 [Waddlia chondrophila 2032/99]|uniref:ADP,ATP carrier protein n=2 Tax=Waddlia chondrophila TaxID=71667 RepID=D6YTX8_WADCW|nr:Npt1/Npt2 family nucleotide transporter [Waddlia chondrophila]ADI37589.1 ADP/ATP translocase [Waddlia chondrophila WSU 86-1044]CCB91062.1 ADP,ATP carrier protein 1 [Waddlia chondrophila 2032/99]
MNHNKDVKEFSFWRGVFFPVHLHELKFFAPMALMMLFILCNYTVLRNIKDTLVVNAKGSDAEIISFLKLWGTMPAAFLFMLFYSKITDLLSRERIFYLCLAPFLIFFGSFAFLIYPNIDILHPDPEWVAGLKANYPNFKWFIAIWANWSYSLFYILAELWGSVILSLLFWQFANDTVKKEQTKRFYPLFGMVANIGLVAAGSMVKYFSKVETAASDPWQVTLNGLMPIVVISGMIIAGLFYRINRRLENRQAEEVVVKSEKKAKPKVSLAESFKILFTSPHLLCIAIVVLSYGVSINYVDVIWKGQAKAYFAGDKNAFANYMGNFAITTGCLAIPIMLIGGNILRYLSWKSAALITPVILLVTGFGFFSLILTGYWHGDPNAALFTFMGVPVTFLGLGVQFGLFQNAVTKATKYSLFDPTKEMAYIPLSKDFKTKGKAAVDVVGSRLGKSGGALTFFIIQTILPNVSLVQLIPLLAVMTVLILCAWIAAVFKLSSSIKELEEQSSAVAKKGELEALGQAA